MRPKAPVKPSQLTAPSADLPSLTAGVRCPICQEGGSIIDGSWVCSRCKLPRPFCYRCGQLGTTFNRLCWDCYRKPAAEGEDPA
jgi:hypothetical protein